MNNPYGSYPTGDNSAYGSAPNYGAPGYGMNMDPSAKPNNYLAWTILATVLCCVPLGAFGIYKSTQVDKLWNQGDAAGAQKASNTAKQLAIWSAVLGLIFGIIGGVLQFMTADLDTTAMAIGLYI